VTNDTSLTLIKEKVQKERELEEAMRSHEITVNGFELRIATLDAQLAEEKNRTAAVRAELEAHKLESSSTLKATEEEILCLRKQ